MSFLIHYLAAILCMQNMVLFINSYMWQLTKQHALHSEELVRDPTGRPGQKWLVEIGARCEDVKMQQSTSETVSHIVDTLQPYFLQSS